MGNTVINELRTYFTGDAVGFEKASGKVNSAIQENIKREREAQKLFAGRADSMKGALLNPLATAGHGADKLVKSLKISSLSAGVLGAGVSLAAAGFRKANDFAGQTADRLSGISETMRQTSRVNIFATSADGVDSLSEKLATLRGQALDQRAALREANPYGFGGGVGGNMLTAFSDMQMSLKSSLGLGPYNNFDRQKDEQKMAAQWMRINAQEQAKLVKLRSQATVDDLRITREKLTADRQTVEISELQLEKTRALARAKADYLGQEDKNRIAQRFDLQIAFAKQERYIIDLRNMGAAQLLGIQASISSEAEKQIRSAQKIIELNKEEMRLTITPERRQALTEQNLANTTVIAQARREALMGKSPAQINRMVRRDQQRRLNVSRFDERQKLTAGLINPAKDMAGNIVSGLDPITGMMRAPEAGKGLVKPGLQTGSLSDRPMSMGGGPSLIRDHNPNGGLSTSGTTPRMFERTSAAEALDKPTAASAVLSRHDGDPAHDPIARMNAAPIFPNLAEKMKQEFSGGYRIRPDDQAKLDRQGEALTNSQGRAKLGEQRQYGNELVRQMKEQSTKGIRPGSLDGGLMGLGGKLAAARDIGSSRTASTALVKIGADQLTAQSVTNNLLGQVVAALSNFGLA